MTSADLISYLLAEFRCATLRAQMAAEDLHAIRLALRNGLISPLQAICHIEHAFRFLGPLPSEIERMIEVGHA